MVSASCILMIVIMVYIAHWLTNANVLLFLSSLCFVGAHTDSKNKCASAEGYRQGDGAYRPRGNAPRHLHGRLILFR